MIRIQPDQLKAMHTVAEKAFPEECCGLVAGQRLNKNDYTITRIVHSDNIADTDRHRRFEIDPQVRFDLMRELESTNEDIIGHYHSHPGHAAEPSETDLAMAYEPEMLWLIMSLQNGYINHTAAFGLTGDARAFYEIDLSIGKSEIVGNCPRNLPPETKV